MLADKISMRKGTPPAPTFRGSHHAAIVTRFSVVLAVCTLCGFAVVAQSSSLDKFNAKSLEAAASYAQSLAQWAFIIIGGSLVLVLGNSHRWPRSRRLRATYLLFLLAWTSLALCIYFGTRVQQANLAYLLVPSTTIEGITKTLANDLRNEIWWMFTGLFFLSLWLLIYLVWSVVLKDPTDA
jgi:hypothetical protein